MSTLHALSLLDASSRTQEDTTHVVFLEVHDDGHRAVLELKKLISLCITKTIDTSHTITDGEHSTNFVKLLSAIYLL